MRDDVIPFEVADHRFEIEGPTLKDGLRATITLVEGDELIYSDRINLDRLRDREKWGDGAGIEHKHLLTLREKLANWLAGRSDQNGDDEGEAGPDTDALAAGRALLNDPNLLDRVGETIQSLGYAGDLNSPKLVYLTLTSRHLARPISVMVFAQSSAGKSFLISIVLQLMPDASYYALTGMSERVLAYTDADFQHRHIIVNEASALTREGIGASLMRSIISEGRIVYETIEKTSEGMRPRRIEKQGPIGLVTTTTKALDRELETRLLTLTIPDNQEATRDILQVTADRQNGHAPETPDLEAWHAVQWILEHEGSHVVTIPYAGQLANQYPTNLVRARRDFPQLLSLISAHALLYQFQRDRDDQGRIVANEDDYRDIYDIAGDVFGAIASEGLTPAVRETVEAVAELLSGQTSTDGEAATVTTNALATHLNIDRSATSKRIGRALSGGWLINDETRHRRPAKLRIGEPMPKDRPALPTPEKVFVPLGVPRSHSLDSADSDAENSGKTGNVPLCSHTPTEWDSGTSVGTRAISHTFTDSGAANGDSGNVGTGKATNKKTGQQFCSQCGGLIANAALQEMGLCWECAETLGWTP